VRAGPELRAGFVAAARMAREQLGATLVPKALLTETMSMLADYRSEREVTPRRP
jgi:hypothetical protein